MGQVDPSDVRDAVAIVGMGCRFPGGIHDAASYWQALCDGRDAIRDVPQDRWNVDTHFDPHPERSGKLYTRRGGFLDDIFQFEPGFFGISPREAVSIDPQQRLLLELTWEALEDAGMPPERLAGRAVGVFVGLFMHDFENLVGGVSERPLIGPHSATGSSSTIAANRISYSYDFRGPSLVVDTACSSSLVAVHLACKSLLDGESELALAGGVNVLLRPEMTMFLCRASFLSPDGYCKSFDARANGYTRSEGAGLVVLKRLSRALADNDPIYAVIRGSAVNQDGRSDGLTVPSSGAQMAVLREALERAGVAPSEVAYVEAHGTGTPTGDPIEARALGTVLSAGRGGQDRCVVGSVKSNIGHTESAAGIAGLIKAALVVQHGMIPPNLHFETPNPQIPFDELRLRVPTQLEAWPLDRSRRIAGINSFGFGGTNAHVVIEAAPCGLRNTEGAGNGQPVLLPLSAKNDEALRAVAGHMRDFLRVEGAGADFRDIARAAATRKGQHPRRLFITAETHEQAGEVLEAYLAGERRLTWATGTARPDVQSCPVFVYSGMGPQWWAMGRELLDTEPPFRDTIHECDAILRQHTQEWSLLTELRADEQNSRVLQTHIAQPALLAVQAGLTALWRSWGVRPAAVMGHSVGEIAAAHAAGILTLEEALLVAYHRSRLQRQKAGCGGMLAAGISLQEADALLGLWGDQVSVAAYNSASSVTLAGDTDALEAIAETLVEEGRFAKMLRVEVPYHSSAMDSILSEFQQCIGGIRPQPSEVPLVSTVTGKLLPGEKMTPAYWAANVREPVRFHEGFGGLLAAGHDVFIEVGPHPVLAASMQEIAAETGQDPLVLPSLRRKEPDRLTMLGSLGRLYLAGCEIDWERQFPAPGRFVRLPAYPWQRELYWQESDESQAARLGHAGGSIARVGQSVHPLLGGRLESAVPTWQNRISLDRFPYLNDHQVQGVAVFPGAAYLEIGLAVGGELAGDTQHALAELQIKAPLILRAGIEVDLQTVAENDSTFRIYGRPAGDGRVWTLHAQGRLRRVSASSLPAAQSAAQPHETAATLPRVERDVCYQELAARGLNYGPSFQGVEHVRRGPTEVLGRIAVEWPPDHDQQFLHPVLLDACLQTMALLELNGTFLPVQLDELRVHRRPTQPCGWCHARLVRQNQGSVVADLTFQDDDGSVVFEIRGLKCRRIETAADAEGPESTLYAYRWIQTQPDAEPDAFRLATRLEQVVEAGIAPLAERLADFCQQGRFYEQIEPAIDDLCRAYLVRALGKMGVDWRPGIDLDPEAVGVVPQHHRYFRRMMERVAEVSPGDSVDPDEILRRSIRDFPACHAEFLLLHRCLSQLAEVLTGQADPLSLIFGQDSVAAEHLYHSGASFRFCNHLVTEIVRTLVDRVPPHRPLRILEVGAGTGGLTAAVLPHLRGLFASYCFTDISPVFLRQAQRRFQAYANVQYELLNIEQDPAEQGFAAGSFDLVLALDAVHATRDVRASLDNLKRVLAPGGVLVLAEATRPRCWFETVFGLLEGWWLFADHDLRQGGPLLGQTRWQDVLRETGYDQVAAVADCAASNQPIHSVLLATAPKTQANHEDRGEPVRLAAGQTCILFADPAGVAQRLAALLRERGARPILVKPGQTYERPSDGTASVRVGSAEDFGRLLDDLALSCDAPPSLAYLWGLGDEGEPSAASLLEQADRDCWQVILLLQSLLARTWDSPPPFWLVTRGTQPVNLPGPPAIAQSPLWGLGRVMVTELAGLKTRMVDLSPAPGNAELAALRDVFLADDLEDELALRGARRFVHRLERVSPPALAAVDDVPFQLAWRRSKGIDGLVFTESEPVQPGPGQVAVQIRAAGVNFKDVAKVTGLLDDTVVAEAGNLDALGLECAGRVTAVGEGVSRFAVGDHVMGLARNGFRNVACIDARALVHKPRDLDFEQAATIPLAFLAADIALRQRARIEPGERVLIHAAAGGLGLAAIQLAQAAGAEVLATAGTPEKRAYLRSLGVAYVGDSRTLEFVDEIRRFTGGTGVDVVLNTLAGDAVAASMSLLKPVRGRFVDLVNLYENTLPATGLDRGISFFAFDLESMLRSDMDVATQRLDELAGEIRRGQLAPLPYRAFPVGQVQDAFRSMRRGLHIGKIVLTFEHAHPVVLPASDKLPIRADGTYLIAGGLGGFGLALARKLVDCGARHLVLAGRRGDASAAAHAAVEDLRHSGVNVTVAAVDICDERQIAALFAGLREGVPPLRGIVQAAMVLDDCPLLKTDAPRLHKVLAPKIAGGWNLHAHAAGLPLDFFVCFSSVATWIGHADQGNYAAANAWLDQLAAYRRAHGLPGLSMAWGPVGEAGYVAERGELLDFFHKQGVREIRLQEAWQALRYGLTSGADRLGISSVDWDRYSRYSAAVAQSPRFAGLLGQRPSEDTAEASPTAALVLSGTPEERREELAQAMCREVAGVLGIPAGKLEPRQPLDALGFDSLMAVELVVAIEQKVGIRLQKMSLLRAGMTVLDLVQIIEENLAKTTDEASPSPVPAAPRADPPDPPQTPVPAPHFTRFSDEQVDTLLESLLLETQDNAGTRATPESVSC